MPLISKTVLFFCILFGISFWFLVSSDYRPVDATLEARFYLFIGVASALAFFILLVYSTRTGWKMLLYCFIIPTTIFSMGLANTVWSEDVASRNASYDLHPQCEIPSPDGQKILVIKNHIPASSLVDIWIYYRTLPFLGRNLRNYAHGGFCGAKWLDNDKIITHDFSAWDQNEKVIIDISFPEFHLAGLIGLTRGLIFYTLLVLCIQIIRQIPGFFRWLSYTVFKKP